MDVKAFKECLDMDMDQLSAIDRQAVDTVVGLVDQIESARIVLHDLGAVLVDDSGGVKENPAARVERAASAELRGWVKDRPDLFGARKADRPKRERFTGFKAV